jgi:hypothetical protein
VQFSLLQPDERPPSGSTRLEANRKTKQVYFLTFGFASVITLASKDRRLELDITILPCGCVLEHHLRAW